MNVPWDTIFVPSGSLVELVIRGTLTYFVLLVLLRVLVRRNVGGYSITDLLLIVLIADAAQNGMAGDYQSLPEGAVLCATMVAWSYFLDWLAFRSRFVRSLLEPPPLPLIRNGRMQRRHLRQELHSEACRFDPVRPDPFHRVIAGLERIILVADIEAPGEAPGDPIRLMEDALNARFVLHLERPRQRR